MLRKNWPGDNCGIEWIKLIGEVPDYNAIITERIFGKEAFAVFRKYDIRMRFGFINDRKNLEKSDRICKMNMTNCICFWKDGGFLKEKE